MKHAARLISLLMAAGIFLTSAVPVFAFESPGEITNVTDYGESASVELEQEMDETEESEGETESAEPSARDTGGISEESQGEPLPEQLEKPGEEPSEETSGLDPPAGFSFAVSLGNPLTARARKARADSQAVMYMEKMEGLTHYFPFNSTSPYSAYKFYTEDGQTAFCVEPARFNSTHGTVVTGSLTYGGLSRNQQKEIARAIAACGGHSNNERYLAAQAVIWEIAMGQSPRSGSVYSAVIVPNAGKLGGYYEEIRSKVESGGEIPSFMNPDPNTPQLHTLTESGGKWRVELEIQEM